MKRHKIDIVYSIFKLFENAVFKPMVWVIANLTLFICWLISQGGDGKIKGKIPPKELRSLFPEGFIIGKKSGWWVVVKEKMQGHGLIIAGTGKGKTESHFKPSVVSIKGLQVTTDITEHGELIDLARERGIKCKVISFEDKDSMGFDPYYELKRAEDKDEEADILARAIIPDPKPSDGNPMWQENAQLIVKNSILHFENLNYSFLETMNAILEGEDIVKFLEELGHSRVKEARKGMIKLSKSGEKTLGGIYSQLLKRIAVMTTNKRLVRILSAKKNVNFNCLRDGYSIFLHVPEHILDTCRPFSAMFFNQFFNAMERRPLGQPPLTIHLDEAPRWGEIGALIKGAATLRKRRIKIIAAAQSFGQFVKTYGQSDLETLIDNFDYKVIQGVNYPQYQRLVSDMIGFYEKRKVSSSESYRDRDKVDLAAMGSSESSNKEYIVPSAELGKMNDIVLIHPKGHCRVNKMMFHKYRNSWYKFQWT